MHKFWIYALALTAVTTMAGTALAADAEPAPIDQTAVTPRLGAVERPAPPAMPPGPEGMRAGMPGGMEVQFGMRVAESVMERYDQDRNGKLSIDEYLDYQREAFVQADLNTDMALDLAELGAVVRPSGMAVQGAQTQAMNPTQLRQMMTGMMRRLDVNGDRKISKSEANSMPRLAERFDELDTNNDEFIDEQEFNDVQRMMQRMRGAAPAMPDSSGMMQGGQPGMQPR